MLLLCDSLQTVPLMRTWDLDTDARGPAVRLRSGMLRRGVGGTCKDSDAQVSNSQGAECIRVR
jgi:hypothetical protein